MSKSHLIHTDEAFIDLITGWFQLNITSLIHQLRFICQQLSAVNSLRSDWSVLISGNTYNSPHLTESPTAAFNMMTVQFLSGASLFALLVVDICCLPVQKGSGPGASYDSSYTNAGPSFDSYQGAPSDYSSSGSGMPNYGPSQGGSTQYYQAAPQPMPSVPQSASPAQSGAAFQSAPREISWAVAPLSLSGDAEMSAGARAAASGPGALPPGPVYQAGDLSHFESSIEHGNSERETEEQGWLPPPPPYMPESEESAGESFIGQPETDSNMGGIWGPYPSYNYMFLTGQYPAGTYTHGSSSFEHGSDSSQEDHYERYHFTYMPVVEQQMAPAKTPVKGPAKAPMQAPVQGSRASSYGGFRKQG
ncbi:uncharacterized protein LOC131981975 [Centropristis striata]|uniref:uncharacterized protein LOC131981975 n=1 Tax=Centropristis striata TaxID=184440 RepID=UPI0027E04FE1|nr:uncharacterized protein LOC131981975 [Centropristis striata]